MFLGRLYRAKVTEKKEGCAFFFVCPSINRGMKDDRFNYGNELDKKQAALGEKRLEELSDANTEGLLGNFLRWLTNEPGVGSKRYTKAAQKEEEERHAKEEAARKKQEEEEEAAREERRKQKDAEAKERKCEAIGAKFASSTKTKKAAEAEEELAALGGLSVVYDDGKGVTVAGQVQSVDRPEKKVIVRECPNFSRLEAIVAAKKACEAAEAEARRQLNPSLMDDKCPAFSTVEKDIQRTKAACGKAWEEFQTLHDGRAEDDIRDDFKVDFKDSKCPPTTNDLEAFLEKERVRARERQEKDDAQKAKGCADFANRFRRDTERMTSEEMQDRLDRVAIVYDDGKGVTVAGQVIGAQAEEKVVRPDECPNKEDIQTIVDEKIRDEALAMWEAFLEKKKAFEEGKKRLEEVKKDEEKRYKDLKNELNTTYYDRLRELAERTNRFAQPLETTK